MKVKVLQKHIDYGHPNSYFNCPLCRAIMDVIGWNKEVKVFGEYFTINGVRHEFPEHVAKIIERYDETSIMVPLEFEVPLAA